MPRELVLSFPPSEAAPSVEDEAELLRAAARKLRVEPDGIAAVRAKRLSFDARRRERRWRLALDVYEAGEPVPPPAPDAPPTFAAPEPAAPHVVVVGSGPAGLFCCLDLLAAGRRVTLLERGLSVRERRRSIRAVNRGDGVDADSNYCFGEGGAGTYSDGKLYTRAGDKAEVRAVLETLVAHGAPHSILVSWRPHVGSNRLPDVVAALRGTIERSGGSVRFGARVEELVVDAGRVTGVDVRDVATQALERVACDAVVLATGHSALDALTMCSRAGARLEPKGFALGVRVEHPQPWLDDVQYGGLRDAHDLPAAFYELAEEVRGHGVYSFCMCPGGFIVPASTADERVVVNGMSLSKRDSPFANSGLVVSLEPGDWCGARGAKLGLPDVLARAAALGADVPADGRLPDAPADDPLFGVRIQLALETLAAHAGGGGQRAPSQRADCVAEGDGGTPAALESSYRPGLVAHDLARVLPSGVLQRLRTALRAFDATLPGFAGERGQLVGVETRTSSPVRLARDDETCESVGVAGLFPCGEGAGHAGGIVSAALDGRRVARAVVTR